SSDLKGVGGPLGIRLRIYMKPWQLRSRLLTGDSAFSLMDVVAAMVLLDPSLFTFEKTRARLDHRGRLLFDLSPQARGGRPVRIVTHFDAKVVWRRYMNLLTGEPERL